MQTRCRRAAARTCTGSNHRACAGVVAMGGFLLQEAEVRFPLRSLAENRTVVVISPFHCRRGAEDTEGLELIDYN